VITWTPADALLASVSEIDTDLSFPIGGIVTDDQNGLLTVTSAAVSIAPVPVSGTLSASLAVSGPDTVAGSVVAPHLVGVFSPQGLKYRDQNYVIQDIADWPQLPAPALSPDIFAFYANTLVLIDYVVTATVQLSDSSSHSKAWTFRVNADWTAGEQLLREAINARRSA